MSQHVIVVDYDPSWPKKYEEEAEKLRTVLGGNCAALWHIGSTSVPGLAAKPIIDILGAVKCLEEADKQRAAFEKLGYEYLGEFGIAGRRYLRKGGDERTHQVHLFREDDRENLSRHLAFRDYLRAHEDVKAQYAPLKKELARKYPYDIERYCEGKDAFVKETERAALQAYQVREGFGGR